MLLKDALHDQQLVSVIVGDQQVELASLVFLTDFIDFYQQLLYFLLL